MLEAVRKYLVRQLPGNVPFYVFVGDRGYDAARNELSGLLLNEVRTSGFCRGADKLPDTDGLMTSLTDGSGQNSRCFVTGLGEYLALRGPEEAGKVLLRLKDMDTGRRKVILLLRGQNSQLASLQTDPRFDERRYCVLEPLACELSLTLVDPAIGQAVQPRMNGFKVALEEMEKGHQGNLVVATAIPLDESLFTVRRIDTAYAGVRFALPGFAPPASCGNDAQWAELLAELNENGNSLGRVCHC